MGGGGNGRDPRGVGTGPGCGPGVQGDIGVVKPSEAVNA